MSSKMSRFQPSHPKADEAYYDDDRNYDDNDYSDERTTPKARSRLTCGCFLLELWKWWRDIVSIILDTINIVVIVWLLGSSLWNGNFDLSVSD